MTPDQLPPLPPLPEPFLYAHELIANGGGVWLGCIKEGICEQAHEHGETGEVVERLYTADQMHAYATAATAALRAELDALRAAYRKMRNSAAGYSNYCDDTANTRRCEREYEEAEAMFRAIDAAMKETP